LFFQTLRRFGAIGIHILATHALFSGNSAEIINSNLDIVKGVVVTNTVPQVRNVERLSEVLQVIDVSGKVF
jgi:phosphoribosylpyrophosphate synthetase